MNDYVIAGIIIVVISCFLFIATSTKKMEHCLIECETSYCKNSYDCDNIDKIKKFCNFKCHFRK